MPAWVAATGSIEYPIIGTAGMKPPIVPTAEGGGLMLGKFISSRGIMGGLIAGYPMGNIWGETLLL